ncbi:MAG: hypothetical protein ACLP62_01350 [Acidimicrobiales bacterium]
MTTPAEEDHTARVRTINYYEVRCPTCGVLGEFGYDAKAAERAANRHWDERGTRT